MRADAALRNASNLPKEQLLQLYRSMQLIRITEERIGAARKSGEIPGHTHLYIGQEAIATGVCARLTDRDWISSTHRGHGHYLAKGGDVKAMVAEIFGREDGICHGKGGSMHVADFNRGILGANGIVGGGIGLGTGAALAAQLKGDGDVAVVFFGDGAAAQGVFSEAMNIAALWKLPLIFVCENNGFAEFSKTERVTAGQIVQRAAPYGVASSLVDGNDIIDVWQAADVAVRRARAGDGPTLIEAKTYRFNGHVELEETFLSAPYRTEDEVARSRSGDPIVRFAEKLLSSGAANEVEIERMDNDVRATVEDAFKFAANSPWPSEGRAFSDMYA